MMVDFFLISSQASISTFSTMEDQRNGSNKSSYFWWKYIIDVDLSYWKSHQHFPSNIGHISEKLTLTHLVLRGQNPQWSSALCALRTNSWSLWYLGRWRTTCHLRLGWIAAAWILRTFFGGEAGGKSRGSEKSWICISWNCLPWLLWGGEVFTFNDIIWRIKNCQLKVMGFSLTRCLSKWETSNSDNYSWGLSTIETRCY